MPCALMPPRGEGKQERIPTHWFYPGESVNLNRHILKIQSHFKGNGNLKSVYEQFL